MKGEIWPQFACNSHQPDRETIPQHIWPHLGSETGAENFTGRGLLRGSRVLPIPVHIKEYSRGGNYLLTPGNTSWSFTPGTGSHPSSLSTVPHKSPTSQRRAETHPARPCTKLQQVLRSYFNLASRGPLRESGQPAECKARH